GSLYCAENLIVNAQNSTINGDVYVKGNIYFFGTGSLQISGTLYCSGNICICNSEGTATSTAVISGGAISDTTVAGKITGTSSFDNTVSYIAPESFTSSNNLSEYYKGFSTNEIFEDQFEGVTSADELHLVNKYQEAYDNSGYDWKDIVYVDADCTKSFKAAYDEWATANPYSNDLSNFLNTHALDSYTPEKKLWINLGGIPSSAYAEGFNFNNSELMTIAGSEFRQNYTFIILMPSTEDAVVLFPPSNGTDSGANPWQYTRILVDFSNANVYSKTGNETNADYIYDNFYAQSNNKQTHENFCYFLVDCGANADWYRLTSGFDRENPVSDNPMPSDKYFNLSEMLIADCTRYSDTDLAQLGKSDVDYSEKMCGNNIFVLVPNGGTLVVRSQQDYQCIQAILYAPKASVTNDAPSNKRGFLGQAITSMFTNNQCDSVASTLLPAPGSIMDTITQNKTRSSALKLQYFTKSKTS
ncbi:MAG: hypothetical protein ACI4I6_06735, partial [Hominimerdicola sp.]